MFPPWRTSTVAQRALGALRLTRSFLMLEDDHDVDWEVEANEPEPPRHPHRVALRGALPRRTGQLPPRRQICLCPADRALAAGPRHPAGDRFLSLALQPPLPRRS